jgi:hypothetical protein
MKNHTKEQRNQVRAEVAQEEAEAGIRVLLTDASLDQPEHAARRRALDVVIRRLEVQPAPLTRPRRPS